MSRAYTRCERAYLCCDHSRFGRWGKRDAGNNGTVRTITADQLRHGGHIARRAAHDGEAARPARAPAQRASAGRSAPAQALVERSPGLCAVARREVELWA